MQNMTLRSFHQEHKRIDLADSVGAAVHSDEDTSELLSRVGDSDTLYELIADPEGFAAHNDLKLNEGFRKSLYRTLDPEFDGEVAGLPMQMNPGGALAARAVAGVVVSMLISKDLSIVGPDVSDVGADDFV